MEEQKINNIVDLENKIINDQSEAQKESNLKAYQIREYNRRYNENEKENIIFRDINQIINLNQT